MIDVVKSPMYSTGVGLVMRGSQNLNGSRFKIRDDGVYQKVKDRMKNWIGEIF